MTAPLAGPADHPSEVRTLEWRDGTVVMIDQRRLPAVEEYVTCRTWEDVAEAIRTMVIRGAPGHRRRGRPWAWRSRRARRVRDPSGGASIKPRPVQAAAPSCTKGLFATRPTAVNLAWALKEMERIWTQDDLTPEESTERMRVAGAADLPRTTWPRADASGEYGADLIDAWMAVAAGGADVPRAGHPDPLQRRSSGDGRLRHGAGRRPRGLSNATRRCTSSPTRPGRCCRGPG